MEPMRTIGFMGVGAIGLVACAVGASVAANFVGLAGRIQAFAEARATRWPYWLRQDGWGRSLPAIRLYGAGLAWVSAVLVIAALPHAGGTIGRYLSALAFVAFFATWLAAMVGAFQYFFRLGRWRSVAVWNITVLCVELAIFGLSVTVSVAHA